MSTYEGTLQIPPDEVSKARPVSTQSDLYFETKHYKSCFIFGTNAKQFAWIKKLEGDIEKKTFYVYIDNKTIDCTECKAGLVFEISEARMMDQKMQAGSSIWLCMVCWIRIRTSQRTFIPVYSRWFPSSNRQHGPIQHKCFSYIKRQALEVAL